MDKKQRQLILELAERLKKEKRSRSENSNFLKSAGIISSKGKSSTYPNLNKVLKSA